MEEIKHYKCKKCGNDKAINVLPGDSCECGGQEWECYKSSVRKEGTPEKQVKKQKYDWLKPTQFKPGVSGNPKGRPPGKSLKTFLKEHFEKLTDEEKMEFFKNIDPEMAWKMAEGNPDQQADLTSKGEPLGLLNYATSNVKEKGTSE